MSTSAFFILQSILDALLWDEGDPLPPPQRGRKRKLLFIGRGLGERLPTVLNEPKDVYSDVIKDNLFKSLWVIDDLLSYEVTWPDAAQRIGMQNSFRYFPNAIIAFDATNSPIRKPKVGQRAYYRGDKKMHSFISYLGVDSKGEVKYDHEGTFGGSNDRGGFMSLDLYENERNFYDQNQSALVDGGLRGVGKLIYPFNVREVKEDPSRHLWNVEQRSDRVVVEWSIGRIKNQWSITTALFRLARDQQPLIFHVCVLLTNRLMRLNNSYYH